VQMRAARYLILLELLNQVGTQQIRVSWTRCHFGGLRPWLHCLRGRRVAKLFKGMGGYFCRGGTRGVIEAFRQARKVVDCTLVLLGNTAITRRQRSSSIHSSVDERLLVLTVDDATLVNALQRRAAVVLQKSICEGFGLTVTEAMWKGAAVVGGKSGAYGGRSKTVRTAFRSTQWTRQPTASFSS
jgi:glycosyltransferase involved in cell wall biosynthesis